MHSVIINCMMNHAFICGGKKILLSMLKFGSSPFQLNFFNKDVVGKSNFLLVRIVTLSVGKLK